MAVSLSASRAKCNSPAQVFPFFYMIGAHHASHAVELVAFGFA